jgi:sarcosine oxidase
VRVVVVGLGAMGSAVAYHLARRGARVTGVDRGRPPHAEGSSHGESRIIRVAYFEHPLYVPLVRRAGTLWRELEQTSGRRLLRRPGALMVGPEGSEVVEGSIRSAAIHGIPHERLTRRHLAGRFPALRVPDGHEGVLEPGAGVLHPERCIEAHLDRARRHGAELLMDQGVRGWRSGGDGGGVEVELQSRWLRGDAIVVCAGPWLPELLPELPLEIERQVMLWFPLRSARGQAYPADGPSFLCEVAEGELFYGIPDPAGELKVARHHGGAIGPHAALDTTVREEDIGQVRGFLDRYLPDSVGDMQRGVVCRYTNTPTTRFLISSLPGAAAVHVVSACSGHGFKFASAIGEAVAARLLGLPDDIDLSAFEFHAALVRPTPGHP